MIVRHILWWLSFHGISGLCMKSLAHRLPGGIQAQGMSRLPMQAWVSLALGVGHLLVLHTTSVAISVVSSTAPTSSPAQQNTTTYHVYHQSRASGRSKNTKRAGTQSSEVGRRKGARATARGHVDTLEKESCPRSALPTATSVRIVKERCLCW